MKKDDCFKLKNGSVICRNSKVLTEKYCEDNNLQYNGCMNFLKQFIEKEPHTVYNFCQVGSEMWNIVILLDVGEIKIDGLVLPFSVCNYKIYPFFDVIKL